MPKQQTFTAIVRLVVTLADDGSGFKPEEAQVGLADVTGLEHQFLDQDGLPNALGCKLMSTMLAHALAANILVCEQRKFKEAAPHLREVIKTLESGVTSTQNYTTKTFNPKKP